MTTTPPRTARAIAAAALRWTRKNLLQVTAFTLLGALASYLYNVYRMAMLGGYNDVRSGMGVIGEGNEVLGSLWIAAVTTIAFSLASYAWSVGPRRFGQELLALPRDLGRLAGNDGKAIATHVLWGTAVALVARQVVGPEVSVLLAAGLLLYVPSVYGQVLVRLAMRAVYALARLVKPGASLGVGSAAVVIGAMGTIVALWVASYADGGIALWALALGCGAGAVALSRGATADHAAMLGLSVGLAAAVLGEVPLAWADDGGWAEGGRELGPWLQSKGAGDVLRSSRPAAAVGGVAGALGGALGGAMSGGGWGVTGFLDETTEGVADVADDLAEADEADFDRDLRESASGNVSQADQEADFGRDVRERASGSVSQVDQGADFGRDLRDRASGDVSQAGQGDGGERVVRDDASAFGGVRDAGEPEEQVRQDPVSAFGGPVSGLIDPDTGESLVVQDGTYEGGEPGMVWYDEWVTPEEAARRVRERQGEIAAREREIEAWQRDTDRVMEENRAQRQERYAAEREAEAAARVADEARRPREAHIDQRVDRIMEDHLHDPAWMERWTQAQDAALEGDPSALAGLYRDALADQVRTSAAEAEAETRYEQALAVGEWTARGVEMGARGALMAVGGQVVAAHGVVAGVAASAVGMGSIQGSSEGAEAHAQGRSAQEVMQRTAGGFLSGAADGAVGTFTGVPGTSAPVRILLPAASDAAQTYVRTGDAGQALASGVIGAVGGAAGEGVDAILPEGAARTAAGAVVNATASGSTAVVQGGSFQEGFVTGLASDVATRTGGSLGGRAAGLSTEGQARTAATQAHDDHQAAEAQRARAAQDEQAARDALAEGNAERRQPTTLDQQSDAVQALAQTQHDRVRLDADGRVVTDADGNPVTDSVVNARGALDQLRDTAGSRTGKTMEDAGLRDAIVRTRAEALYGPADRATIAAVTPALQADGVLRPGDRLVMDTFSTPGSTPSLGADRDARLVIERPRVDGSGQPVLNADGSPQMQRIEVERGHWELQALSDFARHTQAIATEGGRAITPESHPDYFQRMRDGLEVQGHTADEIAQMTPQRILEASGQEGRDHAWAEAHNQLFTDRFHMEASRGNTDQGVQRVVDLDGRVRAEPTQVASSVLEAGGGRAQLADPEGFARMWQEKSDFYRNNPPEALAQSQKGIAQHMALRDGYRAQGLEPPPLNAQAARAMEIIARAPVGTDATPAALARVEADLQALGFDSTGHAMTAVAWQHEGLKWSRPATAPPSPPPAPPPAPGGLRTAQIGAISRGAVEDETTGF